MTGLQAGESKLTVILGGVGMGKSTLASALLSRHSRTLVIDPRAEHPGDVVCDSVDEFLDKFPAVNGTGKIRVVCRHLHDRGDCKNYLFMFMASDRKPLDGWGVMIDEVDEYCSPTFIQPELRRLVNFRRHCRIPEIIVVARRAAAIHRDLTALADKIYVFHLHERRDLEYVRFECGDRFAEALPNLKRYQHLKKSLRPE